MRVRKKKVVLPLMQTLVGMTPSQRTIIMHHLDDTSQDMLLDVVQYVLSSSENKLPKEKVQGLSEILSEHKCDLRYMCNNKKSCKLRRRKMKQMGGFPLGLVLSAAIPMLLNLFRR